jgi:hypothetical protein
MAKLLEGKTEGKTENKNKKGVLTVRRACMKPRAGGDAFVRGSTDSTRRWVASVK